MEIIINLKMFGIPLDRPENIFCDNNRVVNNTRIPEFTVYKNQNAINYHCVHEGAASGIFHVRKEVMALNLDNLLTKFLPFSWKQ